ncbi:MAG TPA: cupin domain-containing protein [Candidatus Limnocylindrales bacterium]|nr:cupin domain-containing protein [Candidatus Limnocylindrales bacterium]
MEIRRFGVGNRRPEGPPGSHGVTGQVIHSDARGVIAELAFSKGGSVEPHDNPNTTYFIVIEGGGYVRVGEEERRIAAGEAVIWPSGVTHGARTEYGPMRAFVVEFAGPDDSHMRGILDGIAKRLGPGEAGHTERGVGSLADRGLTDVQRDREGEPT